MPPCAAALWCRAADVLGGIVGVGHHVFVCGSWRALVFIVRELCEGGERLALAAYARLGARDARAAWFARRFPWSPASSSEPSDDVEEVDPEDEDLVECLLGLGNEPPALAVAPQPAAPDVLRTSTGRPC